MKSECKKIRRRLSAFLDGALSRAEQEQSARHIADCAACRRELAALEHLARNIAGVPRAGAPDGFRERLSERIDSQARRAKWVRRLFVPFKVKLPLQFAATAALAGVIFFLVTPPLREKSETLPPPDAAPAAVAKRADPVREKRGVGAVEKSVPLAEQTAMDRPSESDAPVAAALRETIELTLFLAAGADGMAEQRFAGRSADKEAPAGSAAATAAAPPAPPPETPAAAVRRLVAEAGGTLVETPPASDEGQEIALRIEVPARAYDRLLNGLRSLGRLDPVPVPPLADPGGRVRIRLRLEGSGPQPPDTARQTESGG